MTYTSLSHSRTHTHSLCRSSRSDSTASSFTFHNASNTNTRQHEGAPDPCRVGRQRLQSVQAAGNAPAHCHYFLHRFRLLLALFLSLSLFLPSSLVCVFLSVQFISSACVDSLLGLEMTFWSGKYPTTLGNSSKDLPSDFKPKVNACVLVPVPFCCPLFS